MRRIGLFVVVAGLLTVALAAPVSAATTFLEREAEKGSSAWGSSGDCVDEPDGSYACSWRDAGAFDGWSRFNGDRFKGRRVCVSFVEIAYDASTGVEQDRYRSGCASGTVTIARDLSVATAAATGIPLQLQECTWDSSTDDFTCADPVPAGSVDASLTLTAQSPLSRSSFRARDQFESCTNVYTSKGSHRYATGTATIDGEAFALEDGDISSGTNRSTFSCH